MITYDQLLNSTYVRRDNDNATYVVLRITEYSYSKIEIAQFMKGVMTPDRNQKIPTVRLKRVDDVTNNDHVRNRNHSTDDTNEIIDLPADEVMRGFTLVKPVADHDPCYGFLFDTKLIH